MHWMQRLFWCSLLWMSFSSSLWAQIPSKAPFIASPQFSSVSYTTEAAKTWRILISADSDVINVWVNQARQEVTPGKLISLELPLSLVEGKNEQLVEAETEYGKKAAQTFVIYYHSDAKALDAMKKKNQPATERDQAWNVMVEAGTRQESNAAQFSDDLRKLNDLSSNDLNSRVQAANVLVGYRWEDQDAKGWSPDSYNFQYSFLHEGYEDKTVNELNYEELGLNIHALNGGVTWQGKKDALNITYNFSRLEGNTNTDQDEEQITDTGNEASFQSVSVRYIRSHSLSWASRVSLQFVSKDFDEEPSDSDEDTDTSVSPSLNYEVFYYLPEKMGTFRGVIGVHREETEGKNQRFDQSLLGLQYHKDWALDFINSELQFTLGTLQRHNTYDEKFDLSNIGGTGSKEQEITRQTHYAQAMWMYDQWLYGKLGYQQVDTTSTIEELFEFSNTITSIHLGVNWVY